MKLMIVDDHAGVRRMIRDLLAASGDTVQECSSGDEAVRKATEFRPDFVTMDVRMPGLSGLDATRAIIAARSAVRIVIVTNYDQPDLRRAATETGAIGLVLKDNLDEVRPLFHSRTTESPVPTGQPQAAGIANDSVLRVLMAEDNPLDCELICLRLTECGYTPVVQRVCCEADMRTALEHGKWDIAFTDHRLPGFSALAALELLRKMHVRTPALCITGSADPTVIARILKAGAFACVSKDDLSSLCHTVECALSLRPSITPASSSHTKSRQTASNATECLDSSPNSDRKDGSESSADHRRGR